MITLEVIEEAVQQAYQPAKFRTLDPDDARQEGRLACLLAARQFDPRRGSPVSFLRYAARWAMIQAGKKQWLLPADLMDQPAREVEETAEVDHLNAALRRLPKHWREVLRMRYVDGMTQKAVGEVQGRTHQAVAAMEQDALRFLRRSLS